MYMSEVKFEDLIEKEMCRKQKIKDKLILIVKNVVADNIDQLAEQIAEEVYEMFEPVSIDELGPRGKEGCFSIDKPRANNGYQPLTGLSTPPHPPKTGSNATKAQK